MVSEKNIVEIYQQASTSKKGSVWRKILGIQDEISQEVRANMNTTGGDPDVNIEVFNIKKSNPNISNDVLIGQAVASVVDKRTRDEFISQMKNESEKSTGMAGLANLLDIWTKLTTLAGGTLEDRINVIRSGFFKDVGNAWDEYKSPNNKKGFFEVFSSHTKNASIANWAGITNENEKKQFITALTRENSTLVAQASSNRQDLGQLPRQNTPNPNQTATHQGRGTST